MQKSKWDDDDDDDNELEAVTIPVSAAEKSRSFDVAKLVNMQ